MYHERARALNGVYLTLDVVCIGTGFAVAMLLRVFHDAIPLLRSIPSIPWYSGDFVRSDYGVLVAANLFAWLIYVNRSGLYRSSDANRIDRVLLVYAKGLLLCVLATGVTGFVFKVSVSRLWFAYFLAAEAALLLGKQLFIAALARRVSTGPSNRRHALVIGSELPGIWLCDVVERAGVSGHSLVGLLLSERGADADDSRVLGRVADLDRTLADHPVDEVFIVGSARELAELAPVAQDLIERGRIVSLVSTLNGGKAGVRGRVTHFDGVPMLSFGPMPHDEVRTGARRSIDMIVSSLALIVMAPLMLLIALATRIVDPGPALFKQRRMGLGRKTFTLYKFRSMKIDAEHLLQSNPALLRRYVQNDYKLPEHEDPRISSLGRFLRKTSLDELPQFWNVLKGDMTLVGPRPIVPDEIAKYEPYVDLLLSVRPGLTGRWQVSGRSNVRYPERAFLDLDYVGSHSVTEDLAIVLRTVPAVLRRRGVH